MAAQEGPDIGPDSVGNLVVRCGVTFEAGLSGARRAEWRDATVLWYEGRSRSEPVDSIRLATSVIQQSWGKSGIQPGETQRSAWLLASSVPFSAAFMYRFSLTGETTVRTAGASLDCGPRIPADPAPPVVTELTVTPATGDIEPGDTLSITYAAQRPLRLWQTKLVLSGACDTTLTFNELLPPSVTRALRVAVPPGCLLGFPLRVSVLATDAALQTTERLVIPALSLVDRTPPAIYPLFFAPLGGSGPDISGDIYGGDSIQVLFNATDNNALRVLVWEVLPYGIRDSVLITGVYGTTVYIRTLPSWSGPIQFRLYARDAAGLTSNVVTTSPDALRIYPTVTRVSRSTTVSGQINDVAIDTKRGMLYLLESNQARIIFLSTATMAVTGTLSMPSYPTGFDLSAGGDSLLVALPNQRALGILDLRQATPTTDILPLVNLDTTLGQVPMSVLALANGKAFVFTYGLGAAAQRLIEVDLATGTQRVRTDAWEGGRVPTEFEQVFPRLARSPDRTAVVLSSEPWRHQRYDHATDVFSPIQTTNALGGITLSTAGQRVAVGLDVFDAALTLLTQVRSSLGANSGFPTRLSPDGTILYQAVPYGGLVRSRVSDGVILDRTPNPVVATAARLSADGTLFVTIGYNYSTTSGISVIELP